MVDCLTGFLFVTFPPGEAVRSSVSPACWLRTPSILEKPGTAIVARVGVRPPASGPNFKPLHRQPEKVMLRC